MSYEISRLKSICNGHKFILILVIKLRKYNPKWEWISKIFKSYSINNFGKVHIVNFQIILHFIKFYMLIGFKIIHVEKIVVLPFLCWFYSHYQVSTIVNIINTILVGQHFEEWITLNFYFQTGIKLQVDRGYSVAKNRHFKIQEWCMCALNIYSAGRLWSLT